MLSFGQVKNSLEQLKKYLTRMQFFNTVEHKIAQKDLDQPNLRKAGNELFLPLINFILIEYSSEIYWKIIEIIPSIKVVDDRQFVQHCLNIARKIFEMDVQLTSDQFLTNKFFERKLQFVSKLSKCVYERHESIKKSKSKYATTVTPNTNENIPFNLPSGNQNYVIGMIEDDEDLEEEVPRVINAIPARIDLDPFPKQKAFKDTVPIQKNKFTIKGEDFEEDELEEYIETKQERGGIRRPNQKPMNIKEKKNFYQDEFEEQKNHFKDFNRPEEPIKGKKNQNNYFMEKKEKEKKEKDEFQRFKLDGKKNQVKKYPVQQQEESIEYVSKEDFSQLLQLVMSTSQTVNDISGKFYQFQAKISADVSNISARVLMLENSVKLLKDNL